MNIYVENCHFHQLGFSRGEEEGEGREGEEVTADSWLFINSFLPDKHHKHQNKTNFRLTKWHQCAITFNQLPIRSTKAIQIGRYSTPSIKGSGPSVEPPAGEAYGAAALVKPAANAQQPRLQYDWTIGILPARFFAIAISCDQTHVLLHLCAFQKIN